MILEPSPPPDNDDWRLNAVARLAEDWSNPWTGQIVPKGQRLTVSSVIQLTKKKQLTIPLPNATALLLDASARAFAAARVIREANAIDMTLYRDVSFRSDAEAFDYIERKMEAIVLAFTAIEAFVNESIPSEFVYARQHEGKVVLEAVAKPRIERHVPIDEKLTMVLPEVLGCSSPRGSKCWAGYKQLKQTRDRLVHMKSDDRKSSQADVKTLWSAVIVLPTPHVSAKALIDHFVKAMDNKPGWHARYPYIKQSEK